MHYIKLAELWNFEDLADELTNYAPEPNQSQIDMQALQLEEQKLKNALLMKEMEEVDAKIAERLSRTENNDADEALVVAKAKQATAVASKLDSETDILDQAFVEVQSGAKRNSEIEDQEYAANVAAAQSQMQKARLNTSAKTIAEI